jgi:putative N6-adenine-specific DNA methylase
MCGSGTICIEAAMIARNIAPGLSRHFSFEDFADFDSKEFENMKKELRAKIFK